jgi:2,4-dienoyl-CoA reductase-like NADH-dependent reductase (Old Yellow Enzyme family)
MSIEGQRVISTDVLFTPFRLKNVSLPNRIVMAPMTCGKSPNQIPGPDVAAYYRRRVEGGTGLILTEGASPEHRSASSDVNVPSFFGKDSLAGWANVLKEVKAAGGHIMPQIWHEGIERRPGSGPYPDAPSMSPSGLSKPGERVGEPMTQKEIDEVILGFAKSAGYAKALGFDGVELHGAHGFVIDQFFWEGTNQRSDKYGGSVINRARFAAEVVQDVRTATGPNFPVLLRFSQWKLVDYGATLARTPQELETFLEPLAAAGVDVFHCSTRRYWEAEFPETGSDMNLAGWTKKIVGLPTIVAGSVSLNADFLNPEAAKIDRAHMQGLVDMLERGDFDLVAIGRALLVNPDWGNKVRAGLVDQLKPWTPEAFGWVGVGG